MQEVSMHRSIPILTAAVLAVGSVGLVYGQAADQQQQQQAQQPAPAAGAQQPAQSNQGAGQTAQTAGAQAAGQADQSAASQAIGDVVVVVLSGNLADLKSHLAQEAQQRFADVDKQAQQLNATINQLKQDYKAKYNQDPDLSKNRDQVFNSQCV